MQVQISCLNFYLSILIMSKKRKSLVKIEINLTLKRYKVLSYFAIVIERSIRRINSNNQLNMLSVRQDRYASPMLNMYQYN